MGNSQTSNINHASSTTTSNLTTSNNDDDNNNNGSNNNENSTVPTTETKEDLHTRIRAINADTSLSFHEKSLRIQKLMTRNAQVLNVDNPHTGAQENDMEPTYHNGILGCMHYKRACKLKATCCDHFVTCRFCHDNDYGHPLDRFSTKEVLCMHCKTVQPVSNQCISCDKSFARYFCEYCRLYENDAEKKIFHCPHCKICRIGEGLDIDFKHCFTCNGCLSMQSFDSHKCLENKFDANCPICHQYMFHSVLAVVTMSCGHGIHLQCLTEYCKTNYKCPLCSKSILPPEEQSRIWWAAFDQEIAMQPLPVEFKQNITRALCNDCGSKTYTPFHFVGIKCGDCGGYSTSIMSRHTPATSGDIATNHFVRYADDPQLQELLAANRSG